MIYAIYEADMESSLEAPPNLPAPCLTLLSSLSLKAINFSNPLFLNLFCFFIILRSFSKFSLNPFVPFSLYFLLNLLRVNRDYFTTSLKYFCMALVSPRFPASLSSAEQHHLTHSSDVSFSDCSSILCCTKHTDDCPQSTCWNSFKSKQIIEACWINIRQWSNILTRDLYLGGNGLVMNAGRNDRAAVARSNLGLHHLIQIIYIHNLGSLWVHKDLPRDGSKAKPSSHQKKTADVKDDQGSLNYPPSICWLQRETKSWG